MLPSLLIIDDFLKNPERARSDALKLDFNAKSGRGNYAGRTSDKPLEINHLCDSVSKRLNAPVRPANGTLHGHCRITLKRDRGRTGVHIDPCDYSGILFLNLPEQCRGGTDFFMHRRTRLDGIPRQTTEILKAGYDSADSLIQNVVNKDTFHAERWLRTMRVPMRFNRLILFSPWLFHNAAPGFGTSQEDGRLVCLMFFERQKTRPDLHAG